MTLKLNWGVGIAAIYGVFAISTMTFVVFAMRQPVDLVSVDYYAEGLHQDQRAEAVENTRRLGASVGVTRADAGHFAVTIPEDQASSARGQITLYRASDARADRLIDLAVDALGHQTIPLDGLAKGRWTMKVMWTAGGRSYYFEAPFQIEPAA